MPEDMDPEAAKHITPVLKQVMGKILHGGGLGKAGLNFTTLFMQVGRAAGARRGTAGGEGKGAVGRATGVSSWIPVGSVPACEQQLIVAAKMFTPLPPPQLQGVAMSYQLCIPPYFTNVLRAFGTIEGIALKVDPGYSIVQVRATLGREGGAASLSKSDLGWPSLIMQECVPYFSHA